jgi:hypothetical protein
MACALSWGAIAVAQTSQPSGEIDQCGTIVRAGNCVLFEGGGGKFVVADFGGFQVGDFVRVVGTVDPDCTNICDQADGCVRGAVVYDPLLLPCGTPLEVPFDPCSGLSAALAGAGAATLALRAGSSRARRR